MKSVIEDIFYGNVNCDNVKNSEEYINLENQFYSKYEEMKKILSKKEDKLFEEIVDIRSAMEAEIALLNFKYGFEKGLSVGMEIAFK